ncbi:MAG: NAD(P)H-dependent oxidoreductase [Butyricicoccus sp.]
MKVLIVDGCLRGAPQSRTHILLSAWKQQFAEKHPEAEMETVSLAELELSPLYGRDVEERSRAVADGQTEAYSLAKQFARADYIVIAVPYWDLSFPAALKIYLEHICVCGITFCYNEQGQAVGLCRAQQLVYLTSCGGILGDCNLGFDYVQALCGHLLGISHCRCIAAEGMDLSEQSEREGLRRALEQIAHCD